MHTVGPGIWREKWKTWKLRNAHCKTWIMVWNSEKRSKLEMNTVWPGIWPKTLKNVENEKRTLSDLDYRVKYWKSFKMRNAHCLTWNMAKNTEKHGPWEMHTVGPGIWKKWKSWKMSNAHFMTWNIARGTEKRWKWEMHTLGPDHGEKPEKYAKWNTNTVWPGIFKKYWKTWKMRNSHYGTCNMMRKLKIMEMRNGHFRTWDMARNTENVKNEKCTL